MTPVEGLDTVKSARCRTNRKPHTRQPFPLRAPISVERACKCGQNASVMKGFK